ncbi:hypothetical protein DAPPUDRAFT_123683, partial [Daphnia pulex]
MFGFSMKTFVGVSACLKSFESGHRVKKSSVFTPQQIEDFITDPELNSPYWLVRKVVCLVGYYGGFRSCELKSLVFENCELDEAGYWFTFTRSKQRSLSEESTICVPRRQVDWPSCSSDSSRRAIDFDPASLLDLYFEQLQIDFGCSREELSGCFFKGCHGKNGKHFNRSNLGKNSICRVGIEVAEELLLPHPETFTGHCWRRSAGTNASNAGVNVTTLMSMMGWSCPKTAMEYVKHSRITSLKMSMYLSNVQRQNVAVPFPSTALERRQKNIFPEQSVSKASSRSKVLHEISPLLSNGSNDLDEFEASVGTQDLLLDLEKNTFEGSQDLIKHLDEDGGESGSGCGEEKIVSVVGTNVIPASKVELPSSVPDGPLATSGSASHSLSPTVDSSNSASTSHSLVPSVSSFEAVDSRLASFLQNFQNHGSMQIHFHF